MFLLLILMFLALNVRRKAMRRARRQATALEILLDEPCWSSDSMRAPWSTWMCCCSIMLCKNSMLHLPQGVSGTAGARAGSEAVATHATARRTRRSAPGRAVRHRGGAQQADNEGRHSNGRLFVCLFVCLYTR